MRRNCIPQDTRSELKVRRGLETTADVKELKVVPHGSAGVECLAGTFDGIGENVRIHRTRANVEGDPDDVQLELLRQCEKTGHRRERGTELESELAQRRTVVREDSEHELRPREDTSDLVQLIRIIERHHLHVRTLGSTDKARRLARVRKYNPLRLHPQVQHLVDLSLTRTIESGAQRSEEPEDVGIRVALDGVERLDLREGPAPAEVLGMHDGEVGNEEGTFGI
jgi:hypothetical protein